MEHAIRDDRVAIRREALERAQAHAELGARLRRAGRPVEAREPLRVAVDLAHRCRATALEELALAELRAAGARPRRRLITGPGALTRSERRIAELAAAGRQNREIAEVLVVTLATVEYHLRNAYRKLGIRSRTQLAEVLVAEAPAAATTVTYRHWESRSAAATATAVSVASVG
jgi:DNA-binding CsgD family transcriptional regulator